MHPVKFGLSDNAISDARLFQGQGARADATAVQQSVHCSRGLVVCVERCFDLRPRRWAPQARLGGDRQGR
eukprot:3660113-Prymnesium_polylepis.1